MLTLQVCRVPRWLPSSPHYLWEFLSSLHCQAPSDMWEIIPTVQKTACVCLFPQHPLLSNPCASNLVSTTTLHRSNSFKGNTSLEVTKPSCLYCHYSTWPLHSNENWLAPTGGTLTLSSFYLTSFSTSTSAPPRPDHCQGELSKDPTQASLHFVPLTAITPNRGDQPSWECQHHFLSGGLGFYLLTQYQ